jgi:hypothetical protein
MNRNPMTLRLSVATLVCLVIAGLGGYLAASLSTQAQAATTHRGWTPPADTVVKVEGNRKDGFGIHFYDGNSLFPPTDSEALAECGEFDTRVARVRCRTAVRVWYRDLAAMRRAIRYARTAG